MILGAWGAVCAMVVAGIAVATQGPINARLGHALGDPLIGAMFSFAIGFYLLLATNVLRGAMPFGSLVLTNVPPWYWLGGLCGVWIVCAAVLSVPVIGALTALAALILGQTLAGVIIDTVGAFDMPPRALDWRRVAAVLCVGAGLMLSRV